MGQYIHASSFHTPTNFLSTAAATDYPASNLWKYTHPFRTYKSSAAVVAGTTYAGYSFDSAVLPVAVFVDNINIASIRLQGASNAEFNTSVLTSDALTVSESAPSGRYKYFALLSDITGASWNTRQHWRILANTSTTVDTTITTKLEVGSLVFVVAATTWDTNMADPRDETHEDFVRLNDDFEGGGEEPIKLGNPRAVITLNATVLPIEMRTTFFEVMQLGRHAPFIFYANDGNTCDAYMVRRRAVSTWSKAGPNHAQPGAVVLAEVN